MELRKTIGPYRTQLLLGEGGDGEVWLAEEPLTGRAVAVKLLHEGESRGRFGRLAREYQLLRELERAAPSLRVPRARRLGRDGERAYLVLDYVPGRDIARFVERAGSAERTALLLDVLGRAAQSLAELHALGVVHGDFKSACAMVGGDGDVTLLDFGGAHFVDARVLTKTIDERFMTVGYAAPEVLGRAPPTAASDVWGLCASAWRHLVGELPFGRGDRQATRARILATTPAALAAQLEGKALSPTLQALLVQGFAHEPAERPTAAALAAAFAPRPIVPLAIVSDGAAPIRASAPLGSDVASLERWVDALMAQGRLSDAAAIVRDTSAPDRRSAARVAVLASKVALAGAAPDEALEERLGTLLADDPAVGVALVRARWQLTRHFGSFDATASPIALSFGWRSLELGELGAAETLAQSALAETRALRVDALEADALTLLAEVLARRGDVRMARAHIARALERRRALGRTPGTGEVAATSSRLALWAGDHSRAREDLLDAERDATTPIDRAHLGLGLAALELALGHPASARDALGVIRIDLDALEPSSVLATRALILELALSPTLSTVERGGQRLALLVRHQLPRHAPELGAALAGARRHLGDPLGAVEASAIARDAAQATDDLPGLLIAAAVAPEPADLVLAERGRAAGLCGLAIDLWRVCGDGARAWRELEALRLDSAERHALGLQPWAIAASRGARSDKADKADKPDKADKADKPDKRDKVGV